MVKSVKYILKRIIIGVGIAFAIMYLKGNLLIGVYANQISPYNSLGYSADINSGYSSVVFDVPGDPWKSHGNGIMRFSFGITKTGGSSTDPILTPRLVRAYNGSTAYVCNFGSTTTNNSTWTGQSFSVECPMNMDSNGLTEILIAFIPFSQNSSSTFTLSIPPDMSFEVYENSNVQVNVDTSATTGAINNQITNDNSNTQNIINNNNQNTQQQIESQKVCRNIVTSWTRLTYQVVFNSDSLSHYNISPGTYTIKWDNSLNNNIQPALFYYREGSTTNYSLSNGETINFDTNWVLFAARSGGVSALTDDFLNSVQIINCRNGNQAIADGQQQLNDTLNDTTGVPDSDIQDLFSDFTHSDTPISDLLLMPITLLQAYTNGMSGSCSPVNLGNLYGTDLILPCINLQNRLGSNLWSIIDGIISIFMIFNLSQLFISAFDGITSLRDDFDSLYTPKHRDYVPKHGG